MVTVLLVGVGELLGVTKDSLVSIVLLDGLPGMFGRGKAEAMGVENFLPWGTGCMPLWAATVFEKVSVTIC